MRKLTKAVLAGAVAMLAMAPTAAQTGNAAQTPDNAHKFLETVLKGTRFVGPFGPSTKVSSSDCQTYFEYNYSGRNEIATIDWSVSRKISNEDALISLGYFKVVSPGSGTLTESYKIDVGRAEMAVRVQKAMEVIRLSCDKTQGLGF